MMKTLKNLYTILAMLAICLCFTACSKDDDNNGGDPDASSIVGTWEYEDEYYYEEVTFKSNGTFVVYSEEYVYEGHWDEWEESGTYSVKGHKLTVDIDDEISTATFTVTSKKLTITDDEGETMIYTKVKD